MHQGLAIFLLFSIVHENRPFASIYPSFSAPHILVHLHHSLAPAWTEPAWTPCCSLVCVFRLSRAQTLTSPQRNNTPTITSLQHSQASEAMWNFFTTFRSNKNSNDDTPPRDSTIQIVRPHHISPSQGKDSFDSVETSNSKLRIPPPTKNTSFSAPDMELIYSTAQTNEKTKSREKRSSQCLTVAASRTSEKDFEWHDAEGFPTKKEIQLWQQMSLLQVLPLQLRDDASTTTSYRNAVAKDATTSSATPPIVMNVLGVARRRQNHHVSQLRMHLS